jgi:hypothetical protein
MNRRYDLLLYALLLCMLTSRALAQAPAAPPPPLTLSPAQGDKISRLADKPQGWSYNLKLGANLNLVSNKDVVGQLDGATVLVGINLLAGIGYLKGPHEWLNTLVLSEAWSNTPDLPFVKSGDLFEINSVYNYFLNAFTGPFVRALFQTSILPTERVTVDATTYIRQDTGAFIERGRQFHLSDAFEPLTVLESVGWFLQPVHSERVNAFGRAGLGGRHTWADGARAFDDDKDTPDKEIKILSDVHQAGLELLVGLDGKELDGRIVYALGASSLLPFINNDDENRSIGKLTRVEFKAALGFGLFSWMSLNYMLKVLRDHQMVEAVQVTNSLLLSFQYSLQKPAPKAATPPLSPETQERIAALEARAESAEARAAAAEALVPPEPPAPVPAPPAPPSAPATP